MAYVGRKSARAALIAADIPSNLTLLGSNVKIPTVTTANLPGAGDNSSITPVDGMLVYNSTLGMLQQRAGGSWKGIASAPTITSFTYSDGASATAEKTVIVSLSCGTTNTSTTVTAASTTGIVVGQVVSGVGVPLGATVVSISANVNFVLSSAATATATVTLTFGGVVTITGTNFDSILAGGSANIAVTFDGTSATSISVNSLKTIITCTPPAHAAGTITLLLTNASGLTASTDFVYDEEAVFTTAAGSIGGFVEGTTFTADASAPRIQATDGEGSPSALTTGFDRVTSAADDTVITTTIGGLTLLTSGYLTGDLVAAANATTYPFYATAKDSQNQRTAPRLFNIISYDYAASGGTETTYTGFRVHTFLVSGTFTVNAAMNVDYLVIAGGGGGGKGYYGMAGGGGAGGFRSTVTATGGGGSLESQLAVTTQAYTITVGAGGAGGGHGLSGSPSAITPTSGSAITSIGGGGAGGHSSWNDGNSVGKVGGSGGGGGMESAGGAGTNVANGDATNQGFGGGTSVGGGNNYPGGGGGGAGAVGVSPASNSANGGNGGAGVATSIRANSPVTYAGGGGGTTETSGTQGIGGTGGGGAAGNTGNASGVTGTANTGSGGGGGYLGQGSGGSGIVVIRYAV